MYMQVLDFTCSHRIHGTDGSWHYGHLLKLQAGGTILRMVASHLLREKD